ncbi:MAG: response regulator [Burkholderiaceae bacterium]
MAALRILYVEDNDDLRETIGMLLEGEGREIVPCPDAEHAIPLWSENRFDVLVTDVSLPGMSGTDLARSVLAGNPRSWVVLCSGYDLRHGLDRLGPNVRALSKPFEPEELDVLLNEIASSLSS